MTQPPVLVDSLDVEPGATGTRTISRDASTGGLLFVDPVYPAGVTLNQLAGVKVYSKVLVVSPTTEYATIQSAIDAIPASSSATNPYLVLITPGVYTENILIEKDGVSLEGWGSVTLKPNNAATPILRIAPAVATTPKSITLFNLTFLQENAGKEIISIEGTSASTLLNSKLLIKDCNLMGSGSGAILIDAELCNYIELNNCQCSGSDAASKMVFNQVTGVQLLNCWEVTNIESTFVFGDPQASIANPFALTIRDCNLKSLLLNHTGAGTFSASKTFAENLTFSGDSLFQLSDSQVGTLSINNTSQVQLINSRRGSASGAGTLQEDSLKGSIPFVASSTETVVFDVEAEDDLYSVIVSPEVSAVPFITNKTTEGFDIEFSAPQTTTVNFILFR